MPTVWADNILSDFAERDFETGWSHTIRFSGLVDLSDQLNGIENRFRREREQDPISAPGHINKLAILAHGTQEGLRPIGGSIQMGDPQPFDTDFLQRVRSQSRPSAEGNALIGIWSTLTRGGHVFLMGCNAGLGPRGSLFLIELSRWWHGATIIGFTEWGSTSDLMGNRPGQVYERPRFGNVASHAETSITVRHSRGSAGFAPSQFRGGRLTLFGENEQTTRTITSNTLDTVSFTEPVRFRPRRWEITGVIRDPYRSVYAKWARNGQIVRRAQVDEGYD
jgi:hypothetical protein